MGLQILQPYFNTHHKESSISGKRTGSQPPSPAKISRIPKDIENPPFYLPLQPFQFRYKLISSLGNGSFGDVTLAKININLNDSSNFKNFKSTLLERSDDFQNENYYNKKSGLVAIKTMTKRLPLLNDYTRVKEVRFILSIPYHQNLVQVYEMFIDNNDFKLHIVMECLDQNLYQLIRARKRNHFSQQTLKSILSQILNGIRHIHKNDYFHRDIKPENILVSPSNRFYSQDFLKSGLFNTQNNFIVKIADYGLARHVDNKRPYTSYVSTRWYRAPEILLRKNWYSCPVDIWAFGSVATEVATFRPLFPGSNEFEQTWKVLDVLGTPVSRNGLNNYSPSYGYWDEAYYLSSQLGFNFPQKECIDISYIIPNPELAQLCDVIRACLTWNPEARADVDQLSKMEYFKGTCVDSQKDHISTHSKLTFSNQTKKSENLAGIKSKNTITDNNMIQEADVNFDSTSSTAAINLSFLNENLSNKDSHHDIMNDLQVAPNLTQESLQSTNDENYNSTSTGPLNWKFLQSQYQKSNQLIGDLSNVNLQSRMADNNQNSSFRQKYQNAKPRDDTFGEYNYNSSDLNHELANIDHLITQGEDFIDWDKVEDDPVTSTADYLEYDIKGFTNLQLLLDDNDFDEDGIKTLQNEGPDIFQSIYDDKISVKDYVQNLDQLKPKLDDQADFSGTLYSKYNLRRLGNEPDTISSNNSCLVDYNNKFESF